MTYAHNQWFVGHTAEAKLGVLTDQSGEHWGQVVEWQFGTAIVYNNSRCHLSSSSPDCG